MTPARASTDPPTTSAGDPRGGPARRRGDRRERPTPRLSRYAFFGGRRRRVQRVAEREGSYVDIYGTGMLLAVLWVALMNVADSFFTLVHLQAGGIELNPVAARLLETGRFGFVFWKCVLISVSLLVLTLHKNFRLARLGLWTAAGAYTVLVAYHLTLFRV